MKWSGFLFLSFERAMLFTKPILDLLALTKTYKLSCSSTKIPEPQKSTTYIVENGGGSRSLEFHWRHVCSLCEWHVVAVLWFTCCCSGSIQKGWESGDLQEEFGFTYYLTANQSSSLSSSQTLTVRDLLISNLGQKVRRLMSQPIRGSDFTALWVGCPESHFNCDILSICFSGTTNPPAFPAAACAEWGWEEASDKRRGELIQQTASVQGRWARHALCSM